MPNELVSRRLRNLLMDYLAANSVLREITNEFEAADIPHRPGTAANVGGQRRRLVQEYYNGLDFSLPADARRFLDVLAVFMRELERRMEGGVWGDQAYPREALKALQDQLSRDGYAYHEGTIAPVTAAARLADAKAIAQTFDATHIAEQIHRIEASVDADPALAIGTAKELVESCFKTILAERNVEYGAGDDLLQLGKKVFKSLKLVPDDVPQAAKGADIVKRVLSNLSTVVQGIAELRGLYGTGHGKDGRAKGLSPRHARLVVGAASALVTFAFQTHLDAPAREPAA